MSGVRITGGTLRGRQLTVPKRDVRPTSERARQAYFNIVAPQLSGALFLDLFAGTGAFAFEAVSRGAARSVAVDSDRRQVEEIRRRAAEWNAPVEAVAADAARDLSRAGAGPFDLVYADPPFDFDAHDALLAAIARLPLAGDALVAIEHRRNSHPFAAAQDAGLRETRRAEYGEVWMTFFARGLE